MENNLAVIPLFAYVVLATFDRFLTFIAKCSSHLLIPCEQNFPEFVLDKLFAKMSLFV